MTDLTTGKNEGAVKVRGRWYARIRLPGGVRRRFPLPLGISEERAHEMANAMRERVRKNPENYLVLGPAKSPPAKPGELSVSEYSKRWFEDREARGLTSIKTDKGRLANHVLPLIGETAIVRVTREDVRRVVEALDVKVRARAMTGATAVKVWGLVTKMFSDACEAKSSALRVRAENPAAGVRGPEREPPRDKQWLFPSEVTALLACPDVPLRYRRLYALAAYLYLRPGELAALEWADVDFDRKRIVVRRAFNLRTNEVKGIKTSRSGVKRRTVPIPEPLLPLLRTLHREADGRGRVVQHDHANKQAPHGLPPLEDLAANFRTHLKRAGVERAELHDSDDSSRRVVFYSLRDTGITWEVLADTEEIRLMQRAGHKNLNTTMRYVHGVEDVQLRADEKPFPVLPPSLSSTGRVGHARPTEPAKSADSQDKDWRPQRDSNQPNPAGDVESSQIPAERSPESPISTDHKSTTTRRVAQEWPTPEADPVEVAIATALERASAAGQWAAVEVLARDLEARRKARNAVVDLAVERSRRKR